MRVFITGVNGQLGQALAAGQVEHDIAGGDLPDFDITDYDAMYARLAEANPDVIIHSAALTRVDYCAEHPLEAVQANGVGTYNVALASRRLGAMLVAISTNEVFDGQAQQAYQEYDARNPINPYGYSKYVAEQVVERFAPEYMIVRTSWLYAPSGTNFIHKIIERAEQGLPLRVVTDEVATPTNVADLAAGLWQLIAVGRPGIYHLTNAGMCSRYEFAQEVLDQAGLGSVPLEAILSTEFKRASTPPPYAPLLNVFAAAQGVELRGWRESLAEFIAQGRAEQPH